MTVIPRLHLISDPGRSPLETFPSIAHDAAVGGVDAVHLRAPAESARRIYEIAAQLRAVLPDTSRLFVNDRVDVAIAASAGGIQLGEGSLSPDVVRRWLPAEMLIGRSVHDEAGAEAAEAAGADFLIAGHVYDTSSKPAQAGRGPEFIRRISGVVDVPIIAIGGITVERVSEVVHAGAWGVAVVTAITGSDRPDEVASAFQSALI